VAAVCVRAEKEEGGFVGDGKGSILATTGGANSTTAARVIKVYRTGPFREHGSAVLQGALSDGFDFALSPSGAGVAVVDQLHLTVYSVRARTGEPKAATGARTAKIQELGETPQSPGTPVIQSATRLVQVDAVVTDNHSHQLPGLTAADFTVLENGKPQKITFFSHESPEEKKIEFAPPAPLPPGAVTNRPEATQAEPIVILLLDGLNTPASQQRYVRQEMLKYLRELTPSGSRMAVLALGSDLAVLHDFTTDLTSLQAAVKTYKRGPTKADVETPAIDLPAATGDSAPADAGQLGGESGGVQELLANFAKVVANEEQDTRVRTTISALQAIAQSVSGYPGRKSLLWMSSSFPFTLGFQDSYISPFRFYKSYANDIRKTALNLQKAFNIPQPDRPELAKRKASQPVREAPQPKPEEPEDEYCG